jgi:hypothetical protein
MANEVRTFIEVKSDKNETFKKLQDLFGGADYKEMYETDWLYINSTVRKNMTEVFIPRRWVLNGVL